ncbi:GMC oxidoreductase protein [Rutstroemia sp. NJR-2017a BBW]|nr:GMC oxidoreductase protein [Rutstroemia sp. NJR-2017a BBW]
MRSSLLALGFAARALAQSAASYVDDNTGITFMGFEDTSGFKYGMVLPETVGGDFIARDEVSNTLPSTDGSGYGGVSLTGQMTGSMLVVAWPSGTDVISSLRETSGYTSPGAYANTTSTLLPIAKGTFVNSTHMSYTFLCQSCLGNTYSLSAGASTIVLGWALGNGTVTNPSSASGATFTYHGAGYGDVGIQVANTTNANYDTWAAMASAATTSSSNTTSPASTTSCSNTTVPVSNATYDYIIAGSGPAGIIVAERLAESGASVLMIERGNVSTYASGGRAVVSWNDTVTQYDVPSMSYYLTTASTSDEYCTDTANMAGCLLGGGTMVNALMFVRPQEADFDDKWPTGWKWSDISASAERLYSRNPGTTLPSKSGQRYDQSAYNVLSSFLGGLGWSHVDAIESPNEKTQVYSYPPWDIQDGLRAGPVKSYYPLATAMTNFKAQFNTKVVRGIRSTTNSTSFSGVEVESSSTGARQIINLNAGGKLILAAGSMSTPRILINSGIGPADQISIVQNGSSCVTLPPKANWIDLPVGKNLRDHPIFTLTFNITGTMASNSSSMLQAAFTDPSQTNIDLFAQQDGPLVQSGQRLNFWTSLNTTTGTKYFQGTCNSPAAGQIRIKLYLTHGLTSTGVLGITSSGATEFTTDPWLTTTDDQTAVATMIDYFLNAAKNSTIMQPTDSTLTGASMVAGSKYVTGDHFVGTAMMGASNDGTAVVDTDTKVFGTDNLFVVDASMHPDLPTGNTQAIVMVAAEKAAEKILALAGKTIASSGNVATGTSGAGASASATAVTAAATSSAVSSEPETGDDDDSCPAGYEEEE